MITSPQATEPGLNRPPETYQRVGRVLGPAVFALMMVLEPWQQTMDANAWHAAAVGMWMAIWWATEAIPVAATAFIPLVMFDPLGLATIGQAASHYANPIIFLFLGGFLIATAMQKWLLHKRIALHIILRTGASSNALVAGFMIAAALLSMWVSNTATALMMLPVGLSVVQLASASGDGSMNTCW